MLEWDAIATILDHDCLGVLDQQQLEQILIFLFVSKSQMQRKHALIIFP
jgi:hypothetical protein